MKELLLLIILTSTFQVTAKEDTEPPLGCTLKIDNEEYTINPDEPKVIEGEFKNPTIKLIPNKHKTFTYAGVSFNYPATFSFEADLTEKNIKIWTLDGNDFVIFVYHYPGLDVTVGDMVGGMKSQYAGSGPVKTIGINPKFNNTEYFGTRLTVEIAGAVIHQDIIELPPSKGSRMIMFQDLDSKDKITEDEANQVYKLLSDSFKVNNAPSKF